MGKDLEPGDVPFEIPEFNEDEFVRKELISFKTTGVLFVYSLIVALITFTYYKYVQNSQDLDAGNFMLLVLIAMAFGGLLPFIFRLLKINVKHFHRREWIGTMSLHFFFWLGFTLLLSNPPLNDSTAPRIDILATPDVQGVGNEVFLAAFVGDNQGLDETQLHFCVLRLQTAPERFTELSADQRALCSAWNRESHQVWSYRWTPDAEGSYHYYVHAKDKEGHEAQKHGTVSVANPLPVISGPQRDTFETLNDRLFVRPNATLDILSVRYVIDGRSYNMTQSKDREGFWVTDPSFPGWKTGKNNVTIEVVEQPLYLQGYANIAPPPGRHASGKKEFTVGPDFPDLATAKEPTPKARAAPNPAGTPGFEAAFLVVALIGALSLAGRTRSHGRS
ncbi:MAG TPA: hypothetical protein VI818_06475 [Candidatus Thermoplasmatota archaeon]|nr:hypothetical protein [Candidatus Thermoplasmatota archaeon]